MINLLSKKQKQNIRAARLNVKLLRYCIALGCAALFMGMVVGAGYYINLHDKNSAKERVSAANAQSAQYEPTRLQAEAFSKNLIIAEQILSSQTIYSELVVQVANTLPKGCVLTSLTLTNGSFGAISNLNARSTTYAAALELKAKLEDAPLFEDVNIVNISNAPVDSDSGLFKDYPIVVSFNVTLLTQQELKILSETTQ